jgi:toxin ParE1/3/4
LGIRLTKPAQHDLYRIAVDGLERFGAYQLAEYEAGLNDTLIFLSEYPYAAEEHSEYRPPVRIYPYKAHIIIFEVIDNDVVVIRVCNAREDWTRFV